MSDGAFGVLVGAIIGLVIGISIGFGMDDPDLFDVVKMRGRECILVYDNGGNVIEFCKVE